MLKSERIGYGYERPDRDFRAHDCDLVVIDTKATRREGRRDVMQRLKRGDMILIFSWKELAPGRLKRIMQDELDALGVSVVVLDMPSRPAVKKSRRGVPDDARSEALPMWRDPARFSVECVQNHLARKGLGTYSRNQLNYALGPRVIAQ